MWRDKKKNPINQNGAALCTIDVCSSSASCVLFVSIGLVLYCGVN